MTGAAGRGRMRAPGRETPYPVARKERMMTRDEALTELRGRNGGDLSCVPGPVIMRAIEMLMLQQREEESR